MNLETLRDYCLKKAHVDEAFPFDEYTLAFRLNNKIFALVSLKDGRSNSCNLKCDPEKAIELREQFSGVIPGFHMSKKHWNTVSFNEDVSDQLIFELIDHSYELIFQSFSKKIQKQLSE